MLLQCQHAVVDDIHRIVIKADASVRTVPAPADGVESPLAQVVAL